MFSIQHIDHLVLRVSDIHAMLHFYVDILGGELERIQEDVGLYQIRAGKSLIDLVPVTGKLGRIGGAAPAAQGRNLDHFCLRVEPFRVEEIISHLRDHGIEAGKVESRYGAGGEGPSLYVSDPEGNIVELKGPAWSVAQ